MNFENNMPSKRSRHKRSHIISFHVYELSGISKPTGTEHIFGVARGVGRDC